MWPSTGKVGISHKTSNPRILDKRRGYLIECCKPLSDVVSSKIKDTRGNIGRVTKLSFPGESVLFSTYDPQCVPVY